MMREQREHWRYWWVQLDLLLIFLSLLLFLVFWFSLFGPNPSTLFDIGNNTAGRETEGAQTLREILSPPVLIAYDMQTVRKVANYKRQEY